MISFKYLTVREHVKENKMVIKQVSTKFDDC